jgi:glucosamine--fructose-6-phosphate aminotransferase (isomerizing)
MGPKDLDNELLRQIRAVADTVEHMGRNITAEFLEKKIPAEICRTTNRVILTGCGDSYCAAIAAKPLFENIETAVTTGMVAGTRTEAMRCIEFTRYYDTYRGFWLDKGNRVIPLVCGVSISGTVKRVIEAMERTNYHGGISAAFTDNIESDLAKSAKYIVKLSVPPTNPAPNVTTYIASTYALTQMGLHYSTAKSQLKQTDADEQTKAMLRYAAKYTAEVMGQIEDQAYRISQEWIKAGVDLMDFVGDGADYATAFFGSAKMVESFGGLTTNDDSEGWNHINYFNRTPAKAGTFVVANVSSPSYSRLCETIHTAAALGRPTVVITDGDKYDFPPGAEVFVLPKAEYRWCNPIMQHIPMDYIAAFTGLLLGIPDFRQDSPLHKLDSNAARFRQSKVVII